MPDDPLRVILEGTATETGERFFAALVERLAHALGTLGAWVTEYVEETHRLRALAFWLNGRHVAEYEYDLAGTPCGAVIEQRALVHFPDNVVALFPSDPDLPRFGAVSYLGMPFTDAGGRVLGHLATLDSRPMPADPHTLAVFRIFGARAGAEMRRLSAEAALREREARLAGLVDGAMDAIVELDRDLRVRRLNPAGERVLGLAADAAAGRPFASFLEPAAEATLARLAAETTARAGGVWIPGGLQARRADGGAFPAEATLSRLDTPKVDGWVVILRDVNERVAAERRLRALSEETAWLREELSALRPGGDLLGRSPALRHVREEIAEVAPSDATVLILGETGTGKELVARALHTASRRRERLLVRVNCAALPATLVESELFGHERGAFTGALQRREGRFALADGGTLFLDEIGELPLELQAKLLRVLQEGEFEPLGSSRTRKVDVRILAATNRDLAEGVQAGTFREDLYYRLAVFPIRLPPLRERPEDIGVLAAAFVERHARKLGKAVAPPDAGALARLMAYSWPGNVRELENVIERAVITARNGRLGLERALPEAAAPAPPAAAADDRVLTARELAALERQNLVRALEASDWRVAGSEGAARRLGVAPSTLASRMKALGIRRPRRD